MALVLEVFGRDILTMQKETVITLIKSSPLIVDYRKSEALKEWGEATGTVLTGDDYDALRGAE